MKDQGRAEPPNGDPPEELPEDANRNTQTGSGADPEYDDADATRQTWRPGGGAPRGDSVIGKELDGYKVQSLIGRGSMGAVYKAHDMGVDRHVALKVMHADRLGDGEARHRFEREAIAAGALESPYVAKVFSCGESGSYFYIASEFCDGGTIGDYAAAAADRRLDPKEGTRLLKQAALALLAAERHVKNGTPMPIRHRDIKPDNMLLKSSPSAGVKDLRIVDFGAAKIEDGVDVTRSTAPMTPRYASPEQWLYEETDHRSDMYSLGAAFYHMLAGRPAADGTTTEIRRFTCSQAYLSPRTIMEEIPKPLNDVIRKMTARQKEDRFESFETLVEHLEALEKGEERIVVVPEVVEVPASGGRRLLTVAALLLAIVGGAALAIGLSRPGEAEDRPERALLHRPTVERREDYKKLLGRVTALLQKRDTLEAALRIKCDDVLQKLLVDIRELKTEVNDEIKRFNQMIGPFDAKHREEPAGDTPEKKEAKIQEARDDLSKRRNACTSYETAWAKAIPAVQELQAIRRDMSTSSIDSLVKRLRPVRDVTEDLFHAPHLDTDADDLAFELNEEKRKRNDDLDTARRLFKEDKKTPEDISKLLDDYIKKMEQANETSHVDDAKALQGQVAGAKLIDLAVVRRPKKLDGLDSALDGLRKLLPTKGGSVALEAWKSARLPKESDAWALEIEGLAEKRAKAVEKFVTAANDALDKPDHKTLCETANSARDRYEETRTKTNELLAKEQNKPLFSERLRGQIKAAFRNVPKPIKKRGPVTKPRPVPVKPDDWSDEMWQAWPQQEYEPVEDLESLKNGFWYLKSRGVPMVLVHGLKGYAGAALLDAYEVTFAEFENRRKGNAFGGLLLVQEYWNGRKRLIQRAQRNLRQQGANQDDLLLFRATHQLAGLFMSAYPNLKGLSLPSRSLLEALVAAAANKIDYTNLTTKDLEKWPLRRGLKTDLILGRIHGLRSGMEELCEHNGEAFVFGLATFEPWTTPNKKRRFNGNNPYFTKPIRFEKLRVDQSAPRFGFRCMYRLRPLRKN